MSYSGLPAPAISEVCCGAAAGQVHAKLVELVQYRASGINFDLEIPMQVSKLLWPMSCIFCF